MRIVRKRNPILVGCTIMQRVELVYLSYHNICDAEERMREERERVRVREEKETERDGGEWTTVSRGRGRQRARVRVGEDPKTNYTHRWTGQLHRHQHSNFLGYSSSKCNVSANAFLNFYTSTNAYLEPYVLS